MKTRLVTSTILLMWTVLLCASAFSQGGNGVLTGTVEDASKALIPGVTVTATNIATGVANSTVSNETGSYSIPSLLPGTYRLTATLPGFQTQTYDNITLGTNESKRFNFTMQVASVATNLEVTVDATALLTTNTATVGEVLGERKVQDLPLVTSDVLDLVRIMPGVRFDATGQGQSEFAGLGATTVNTVRDGLSVTDGRNLNGIYASSTINPDLVGEIRLILTPVDAEMGRGNGQVQITTRSGTNRYTGAVVWNNRNTSLNANTWANNSNRAADGSWSPLTPNWANENQITASFGGPIIRNKTFFFALYDRNFHNQRFIVTGTALTDTARQGIFRFWEGWNNGHAETATPAATGTVIASVDLAGNPVRPFRAQGTAGGPYTGNLRCVSVFGTIKADGSPFTAADCPGGQIILPAGRSAWDPLRPVMDTTGFIRKYLEFMPRVNYFGAAPNSINPDGLNTGAVRWLRGNDAAQGQSNALVGSPQLQSGLNIQAERKQINVKIDQNFNTNHKASVGYTYETSGGQDLSGFWPNQYQGETKRRPTILTSNFTSTLSANLLNEFRFGIRRTTTESVAAWESHNESDREGARSFFVYGSKSLYSNDPTPMPATFDPAIFGLVSGVIDNAPFDTTGNPLGDTNPLYNFADTLRWTRGAHALRLGGEVRLTQSKGWNSQPYPLPRIRGGDGNLSAAATGLLDATQANGIPGLQATNATLLRNLLYFMTGSIGSANSSQGYWVDSPDDVTNGNWEDYLTKHRKYRDQRMNEFAGFFQDDWKVSRNVTLNLGLRYEYYGVPYLKGGFTSAPKGLGDGLFGVGRAGSSNLFDNWLYPGNIFLTGYGTTGVTTATALRCVTGVQQSPSLPVSNCDPNLLTSLDFVGPDSPNPDLGVYRNDKNNFGPVVGFAWQVPWFGEGATTVRGGFSVTYGGSGRNGTALDAILGGAPGATHTANLNLTSFLNPDGTPELIDLTDLPKIVPITPTLAPGGTFSIYGKAGNFTAYDPNWKTPYTYNFNLSLTRNLTRNLTLDIRYVGTQGKALSGNQNLNEVNVFNNKELFDALETVRAGGEAPLFDQMFAGLNLNPNQQGATGKGPYAAVGTVNSAGVLQTGSMHLRRWQGANLANGNYEAIAIALNGNPGGITFANIPSGLGTVGGRVLRNGCDRIANGQTTVQTSSGPLPVRCFPENYLVMNPQLGTPTYINNTGFSNYNSLQTTLTMRPMYGLNLAGTYTWSKTMSLATAGYTDPRNRDLDYGLSGQDRQHEFRANGSFELPIGPNKLLLGNSSSWVARLIERWQTSFIFNVASGAPGSIAGAQTLWAGNAVDVVAPFSLEGGSVEWGVPVDTATPPRLGGTYFGSTSPFIKVEDPVCAAGGLADVTDAMGYNLRGNINATTGAFTQLCTNDALALADTGQIVLQNARPGQRGTLGTRTLRLPGNWTFDASMSKTFRVRESVSAQVRVDTTNVLNHPTPANPQLSINSNTPFGIITTAGNTPAKSGGRTFRGTLRITF